MSETANRNLPLVDQDQPQREGAARLNTALSMIDTDIAALLLAIGTKANAADIGPAITAAINALVAGAPAALDTLAEVAAKLSQNDDAVAAIMSSLSNKANAANVYSRATVDNMVAAEAQARLDADAAEALARTTADNARQRLLIAEQATGAFQAAAFKWYTFTGAGPVTFPANPAEDDEIALLNPLAETTPYAIDLNGKPFEGSTTAITVKLPITLKFRFRFGEWRDGP